MKKKINFINQKILFASLLLLSINITKVYATDTDNKTALSSSSVSQYLTGPVVEEETIDFSPSLQKNKYGYNLSKADNQSITNINIEGSNEKISIISDSQYSYQVNIDGKTMPVYTRDVIMNPEYLNKEGWNEDKYDVKYDTETGDTIVNFKSGDTIIELRGQMDENGTLNANYYSKSIVSENSKDTKVISNGIVTEDILTTTTNNSIITTDRTPNSNGVVIEREETHEKIVLEDGTITTGKLLQRTSNSDLGSLTETYNWNGDKGVYNSTFQTKDGKTLTEQKAVTYENGKEVKQKVGFYVLEQNGEDESSMKFYTYSGNDYGSAFKTDLINSIKNKDAKQTANDVISKIAKELETNSLTNIKNQLNSHTINNYDYTSDGNFTKNMYNTYDERAKAYNDLKDLLKYAHERENGTLTPMYNSTMYDLMNTDDFYKEILAMEDELISLIEKYESDLGSYLKEMYGMSVEEYMSLTKEDASENPPGEDKEEEEQENQSGPNGGPGVNTGQMEDQPSDANPEMPMEEMPNMEEQPLDEATQAYIDELLAEIQRQQEEMANMEKPETESDTSDEEQAALDALINAEIDALSNSEELKINEDTFTSLGMVAQKGDEIPNATWKYYISTDIEIISDVSDYSIYGLADLDTSIDTETKSGTKTVYSHVYDVDGKVLQDSVAKSTQTGLAIISYPSNDPTISSDFAFVRVLGKGNKSNYDVAGYATITLDGNESSPSAYKLLVTGNRTSIDKKTTTTIDATNDKPVPDTLKTVVKLLTEKMYEVNVKSFTIGNAGTIIVTSPENEFKVVPIQGEGHFLFYDIVSEDGYRETWSYCEDQVLITSEGTRYAINDVLRFDIYSISNLIEHGFVCQLNGRQATSEDAQGVKFKPSAMESGLESDSSGKLLDNDSENVIPEDGIDRNVIAVLNGLEGVDLTNAYSEYIYSSNNYDYFIPEGVKDNTRILFTDKDGNQKSLTVAEALAQKYMNADEFVKAMGKVGIEVNKIAKTSTTPDFKISIKEEEGADTELTEIYRDDKYSYSVAGSTLGNRVVIIMADGRKYRLNYVLEHNIYSIDELELKGLTIYKKMVAESAPTPEIEEETNSSEKEEINVEEETNTTIEDTSTPTPTTTPQEETNPNDSQETENKEENTTTEDNSSTTTEDPISNEDKIVDKADADKSTIEDNQEIVDESSSIVDMGE